jgi:eukaryotic-like serine/threonine-protein kinase
MILPKTIGRFNIESLLGRGAMGVVYKAHDPDIDRPVAIKLVRADLIEGESREQYLARFRNEARSAGRCAHPNIVSVYDFALHEGNPYLVMEYVDGLDLGRAFGRCATVAVATVTRVALQILDALAHAHDLGIVHRDIKPANVLLSGGNGLKVTDFGISRLATLDVTQSAMMIGTPNYMSPEQCRGIAVDHRCDLFSLGCVMHELLTGVRVFVGVSYEDTLYKLIHVAHTPVRQRRPDVSEALSAIIDRALAKQAGERFETARAMAAAIGAVAAAGHPDDEGETVVLRPSGAAAPAPAAPGAQAGSALAHLHGSSISTIERRLAYHIGPIAGYHMRRALRDARSAEEFCGYLSQLLPADTPRGAFMQSTLDLVSMQSGPRTSTTARERIVDGHASLTAEDIAHIAAALAQIMGPIAPRLVARARILASTYGELEANCADIIENPAERTRFRALLGRPRR